MTVRTVGGSPGTAAELRERITAETRRDVDVVVIREDGDISTAEQRQSAFPARVSSRSLDPRAFVVPVIEA